MEMQVQRGQRLRLSEVLPGMGFEVGVALAGLRADLSCFGLDGAGRLADEHIT
ncbi:hypothetical protein [Caldichromatium japonicum]|uniref:hypothetical protein n=1 Tax=Caldichromatium japonicum TaxID=2699430 RepID=UPI001B356B14|nr:hypothetical protein [Caldichromatium japonicum]